MFSFLIASAIIIGIILLVFKALKKPKDKIPSTIQKASIQNKSSSASTRGKQINDAMLYGKMFQVLESVDVILTTKNRDILTQRFHFVQDLTQYLKDLRSHRNYTKNVNKAVEEYKVRYYDKTVAEEQLYFLQFPEDETLLTEIYIRELARCFSEYSQMHQEAIDGMVQKKAKINRYQKILDNIYETITDLKMLEDSENKISVIEQLRAFVPKIEAEITKLN